MKRKSRNLSTVEMVIKYLGKIFTVTRSFGYFTVAFTEEVVIKVKYDYACY